MARKRYVFWRDKTGKPARGENEKNIPKLLLEKLGGAAKGDDFTKTWGSAAGHYETALKPYLAVIGPALDRSGDQELNDEDAWSILLRALVLTRESVSPGDPIPPDALIAQADLLASEFFRTPVLSYFVVTSLTILNLPSKTIKINGSQIAEVKNREKRFPIPNTIAMEPRHADVFRIDKEIPSARVRVKTSGRSVFEALGYAMDDLTLLRGLWTIATTYRHWPSNLFGPTSSKQLGVVHAGPVHTIHALDGKPVGEIFWQERQFSDSVKFFTPDDWVGLEKTRRWGQRKLRTLRYGEDLKQLIIRYAVALDQLNFDMAFLQMWGILEKLTDTVGDSYDSTIKRACAFFEERELVGDMLRAARLSRNGLVHSSRSPHDVEQVVYLVKSFVDPHLSRLLNNWFKIDSLQEYGMLLEALAADDNTIKDKHRFAIKAARLRAQWSATPNLKNKRV